MINLARKDIEHTLGKFLVTAIGVGMLLGIVMIMVGVYRGMIVDAKVLINDINADLWVVQQDTLGPFAEASRIHEDFKDTLRSQEGIAEAEAMTFQAIQLFNAQNQAVRVNLVGYDPFGAINPINPNRMVEGRDLQRSHYEIVVSQATGFVLGDRIKIGRDVYTVVGVSKGTVSSGGDPLVYVSLKDAQKIQFLYSNARIRNDRARGMNVSGDSHLVNTIVAQVDEGADVKEIAENIAQWKHKSVYTNDQEVKILTENMIKRASKQIGMFTVILVIVSTVIIALIIYTMTLEKIKEISIMKLIGIPNWTIIKMIVQETVVLGVLAFVSGNLFAHLIYDKFPKRVVLLNDDAFVLFTIIMIASILASFFGVHKVIKADPTQAIGG